MRGVAPRVAPKLLVLIPIKPAGASTKFTYVGAGAGACVRIDWIGFIVLVAPAARRDAAGMY